MPTTPLIVALVASVALGVYLGFLYLARVRRPVLITLHLLLGAAGLLLVAWLLQAGIGQRQGLIAALLLALAMTLGLAPALLARRWRVGAEVVLAIHAFVGIAGLLVVVSWVKRF